MSERDENRQLIFDAMDEEQLDQELRRRGWRVRGETVYWGGGVTLPFRKDVRSGDPDPERGSASGRDHAAAIRNFLRQLDADASSI